MSTNEENGGGVAVEDNQAGDEPAKYPDLLAFLRKNCTAIAEAGPKSAEQIISQWRSAVAAEPGLAQCTPKSVLRELVLANRLDVDFGTRALGEAFIECRLNKRVIDGREYKVPEARLGLMYAGRLKIALRNGAILDAYALPVFEGDTIEIQQGTVHAVAHKPDLAGDQTFERLVGCYAVVVLPNVGPRVTWLEKRKIEAAARKSTSRSGPWFHPYEAVEMGRKVALTNALKYVPRSGADLHEEDPEPMPAETPKSSGVAQRLLDAAPPPIVMDLPKPHSAAASGKRAEPEAAEGAREPRLITHQPMPAPEAPPAPATDAIPRVAPSPDDPTGQTELVPRIARRPPKTATQQPEPRIGGTPAATRAKPLPPNGAPGPNAPASAQAAFLRDEPSDPAPTVDLPKAARAAARRCGMAIPSSMALELARVALDRYGGDEMRAQIELEDPDRDWGGDIDRLMTRGRTPVGAGAGGGA